MRSLLGALTLASIYLGGLVVTEKWAITDLMKDRSLHCESPMPFAAVIDEPDQVNYRILRRYYFCCLGWKAPLPYAPICRDRRPLVMGGVIPHVIVQVEEEDRLGVQRD